MSFTRIAALAATFAFAVPALHAHEEPARNTLVPAGQTVYQPRGVPDRIVLVATEEPATRQTVNWRTHHAVSDAVAQITEARDSAGLHLSAQTVAGMTHAQLAENGLAHHHTVTFEDLRPDTLYAYRVRGEGTWSEWFHFRTARQGFAPFSFLYFGDAQNSIKSHFSRVIRGAWADLPGARLMVHAGDLVNQRAGVHDDEWGEWFEAGGFLHGMVASLPVTGNHEFLTVEQSDGSSRRVLADAWSAHFTVPSNGPAGLEDSVYYVDYQGVLFVSLDSTQALQDEELAAAQAQWLDELLATRERLWTVVSHHHPMYSVSVGRDNPRLRTHWKPVYDRHGVDLVLQGHDHTYGRGANVPEGVTVVDDTVGTVYVVSVAGPKMYRVADTARELHRRVGEDVQLYQTIHVEEDRLRFESRTVTGQLYDAFDLVRGDDGRNRMQDRMPHGVLEHSCSNPAVPRATRCWEGTELVH